MPKKCLGELLPHLIAVVIFLLVAVIYCKPAFENKVLVQEDVTQWKAMAQDAFKYKEKHGHFPLWTQGMFSGMPTYQIAMDSQAFGPQYYLYAPLSFWLKKPANYFFLACLCFYFLTQALRVNPYIGIIGSLAYAYSTYHPVIIFTGHDTKMQSLAILPAFIGSLILLYERKYWRGVALTALFTALLIGSNHPQIVYYGMIIAGFMTLWYCILWIRKKETKQLILAGVLAAFAVGIGVMTNAVQLYTTMDYAKATIRGGSELADGHGRFTKTGLSEGYAFSYSLYKTEPFELLVPKIYGGSGQMEIPEESSKAIEALQQPPPQMPPQLFQQVQGAFHYYWGGIGDSTGGPAYAGAIICFLALLGMFICDNKHKWWIAAACVLAVVMSWGGYFPGFNSLLLQFLPGYNKFRAPSVMLVIPVFLLSMLAVLALQEVWVARDRQALWVKYKKGLLLTASVFVILFLLYWGLDYSADSDRSLLQQANGYGSPVGDYVRGFVKGMKEDRQSLFFNSLLRSLLFIIAAAILAGLYIRNKIKTLILLGGIGLLAFIDVMGIDLFYLNSDHYKDAEDSPANFVATAADKRVLQDSGYYRVFDLRQGLSTLSYGAPTAYFHHSIGGYHPAKLSIYEDLIENQLYAYPNCQPVMDMLNTKYVLRALTNGKDTVLLNPGALGAAWFVKGVRLEPGAKEVMNALTGFNPRDTAILFQQDQGKVANVPQSAGGTAGRDTGSGKDSVAGIGGGRIDLEERDNDEMVYRSKAGSPRLAVFSEMFYDRGWKAYLADAGGNVGQELPIIRTNYVLRGVVVPAGDHRIRFIFHPHSYYLGQVMQTTAGIVLVLLLLGAGWAEWRSFN